MSPLLVAILASLLALVIMYIDSKLFDNPKSRGTYIKNMVLVGSITGFFIYLIGSGIKFDIELDSGFVGNMSNMTGGINEEIMTGLPQW